MREANVDSRAGMIGGGTAAESDARMMKTPVVPYRQPVAALASEIIRQDIASS